MAAFCACGQSETQSLSEELDRMIENKPLYDQAKEARIAKLRDLLQVTGLTAEQEYAINDQLYTEFWKYRMDSAIHYTERNLTLAHTLSDSNKLTTSTLYLAQLYSSIGMCIEAQQLLLPINSTRLSKELLPAYYKTYSQFYQHYAAISNQKRYLRDMDMYKDSVILVSDPSSIRHKIYVNTVLSRQVKSAETETRLLEFLEEVGPDSLHYAEVAYLLGSFYRKCNNDRLSKKYYMLSAISDIKNSTKENASFLALASLYYNDGDLFKAFKYAQAAIEDALFSNVQFRTAQMSELYSIINASHQSKEAKTKYKLQHYLILISVLSIVLILLFIYVYKQVWKLYRIKDELSLTNGKLAQLNGELNEINDQLSDANTVKVQYIARFFDLCSMYIDKMDDYRKSLKKLAQDRQFEELYKRLKSTSMLEEEQDELYKNFDVIFLNLYPSFVEDFNALLNEDERIVLKSEDLLNKELRIYALVRLGITDNVKIASFLRCSLSTVYNYRTKMRNKAAISREDFEKRVMKIGSIHKIDE